MNDKILKQQWQREQEYAFRGWDFSHLDGRWKSECLPWDYAEIIKKHLKCTDRLLDMGTGGGEFLLSLNHPCGLTTVTEAYPPNLELCQKVLSPLGIPVVPSYDDHRLPFQPDTFDIITNRHESFDLREVKRILKRGGYFITQQVGNTNNHLLTARLIDGFPSQFQEHNLERYLKISTELGLELEKAEECFPLLKFYDIDALVYYAKIIQWEFPGFSVESCFKRLCECHHEIEKNGYIESRQHRFILIIRKP